MLDLCNAQTALLAKVAKDPWPESQHWDLSTEAVIPLTSGPQIILIEPWNEKFGA